jgi:hypothetical protein
VNVNLSDASTASTFKTRLEQDGFAVVSACLDEATVELLSKQFDDTRYPERNLLSVPSVQALAISKPVHEIIAAVLGQSASRFGGFSSIRHEAQTGRSFGIKMLTIAVRERREVNGFGPWTMKAGVLHVQPPAEVMSGILAISCI